MYRPKIFREDDVHKLVDFMRANSFATLVSIVDGRPHASHIPLIVTVQDDDVILTGHLAKQNPQCRAFDHAESLAIFTGPHAYISPQLYEKRENVPTWNYIAVHAYGRPQPLTLNDAPERMADMIDDMVNAYEVVYQQQWHSLSEQYRNRMMNGIIGFEMPVTRLEGKFKLSQNRSQVDQKSVADALQQSPDPTIQAVGLEMDKSLQAKDSSDQ
ncbi:MAG: FMN-binding negative transcriptional regulator [Cyanobacteria bacterium P01_C01_bin.147]